MITETEVIVYCLITLLIGLLIGSTLWIKVVDKLRFEKQTLEEELEATEAAIRRMYNGMVR